METIGRTYDVTQLTGQFAEYNQELDAVVMTCGTPFTNIAYTYSAYDYEATDGSRFNVVEHWPNTDNATVDDITFRATIILKQVNGYWKLHSILEGDLEDDLGVVGTFGEPEQDTNEPTSDGNLRFDGYYYGLVKDDKVDCYLYLRFYPNGNVATVWSVEALTNAKSRLDKNIADTTGDSGTYSGYYGLSEDSHIKGELLPALRPDDSGSPYRGCISGTVEGDAMHLMEYYTDVGTSQEVTLTFVPFE